MANQAFKPYGKPQSFEFDEYKELFELWHKKWEIFLSLSTINTALDAAGCDLYKAHTLLSCLSSDTHQAVLSINLTDVQLNDHTVVINHLRARCNAGRNRHVWRQQFASKKQGSQQAADDWLCKLRDLARKCEFATDCCALCEPTRNLGQLISGVYSDEVRVKLLEQGAALTLDQALTILLTAKVSNTQSKNLKHGEAVAIQGATSSYKKFKQPSSASMPPPRSATPKAAEPPAFSPGTPGNSFTGCWYCGNKTRCKPLSACPAQGKQCGKCGFPNHFGKMCRSRNRKSSSSTPKQQSIYLSPTPPTVGVVSSGGLIHLSITPDGDSTAPSEHTAVTVMALPDTGADLDAIPESYYAQKFGNVPLRKGVQPVTAVGSPIVSLGVFCATIDWVSNDKVSRPVNTTIHVLRDLKQPVLSKCSQQELGMLPLGYPHARINVVTNATPSDDRKKADLSQLMNERPSIFDGECRPMAGPPCRFHLKDDAQPVAMRGSRPVSVPLLPKVKAELDALEEANIIRRVSKPTAWVHPFLVTMKKTVTSGW